MIFPVFTYNINLMLLVLGLSHYILGKTGYDTAKISKRWQVVDYAIQGLSMLSLFIFCLYFFYFYFIKYDGEYEYMSVLWILVASCSLIAHCSRKGSMVSCKLWYRPGIQQKFSYYRTWAE